MSLWALVPMAAQVSAMMHAPIDTTQGMAFHTLAAPETVYVGQQTTYQIGVFVDRELRMRLHRNPEFVPPEAQGMLAYDVPLAATIPETRRIGTHLYEVHIFQRALFPLTAGSYQIPAAELTYALPLTLSFFSREELHTLDAEPVDVVAIPPPLDGRPADYAGAVGDVRIETRIDSSSVRAGSVRAGDPVVLTVRVEGQGNVRLFPRPNVAVPWGSSVPGQERVELDTTIAQVRGTKAFDWLITPRDTGVVTLPAIRYPYFDPLAKRYAVALSLPVTLHVAPGVSALVDSLPVTPVASAPPVPVRPWDYWIPPMLLTTYFWELVLIVLLSACGASVLAIVMWRRLRGKKRKKNARPAIAHLRRLARRRAPVDASVVRGYFVQALSARFALDTETWTTAGALSHALRREGVTTKTSEAVEHEMMTLDQLTFNRIADVMPRCASDDVSRVATLAEQAVGESREQRL